MNSYDIYWVSTILMLLGIGGAGFAAGALISYGRGWNAGFGHCSRIWDRVKRDSDDDELYTGTPDDDTREVIH